MIEAGSGFAATADSTKFVVTRIASSRPPRIAGIEPGDVLQSIDGAAAHDFDAHGTPKDSPQIKAAYSIEILRGDRQLTLALRPRPLI